MIDTSKLDNVLDAILEDGDLELTDELRQELENSTQMAILDRYLSWHGIVNYTEQILDAIDTIAEVDTTHVDWNRIAEAYPAEFEALRLKYETA
jgi:ribosome maturation protein Sdo1